MATKKIIKVSEYDKYYIPLAADEKFSIEEIEIIEKEFSTYIQIISTYKDEQIIQANEYVGYIILPNHIISISPKIPQISFINMLRYATGLVKIIPDYFEFVEEINYYDIIVLFFLNELDKILHQGLNSGYKVYEDNLTCVKGKILFKEHLSNNYNRNDKIFCSYSELTTDIIENRIIKYTLYYLSQGYFLGDSTIDSKILNYYNRLDQINLISISAEDFKLIEYTPLNEHYRAILSLCEILLKDTSFDEEIIGGKKTAISFLVDMNTLFEKFVSNLLNERLTKKSKKIIIEEQKSDYADITNTKIRIFLDILISYDNYPVLILDTKYKEFKGIDTDYVAQMVLYSNSTGVKNCSLVYAGGNIKDVYHYSLHHDIRLDILSFDIRATNKYEFESKCNEFINVVYLLIESLIKK